MRTCPVCGKEIPDNSAFCSYCGTDLTKPLMGDGPPASTSAQPNYSPFSRSRMADAASGREFFDPNELLKRVDRLTKLVYLVIAIEVITIILLFV